MLENTNETVTHLPATNYTHLEYSNWNTMEEHHHTTPIIWELTQ